MYSGDVSKYFLFNTCLMKQGSDLHKHGTMVEIERREEIPKTHGRRKTGVGRPRAIARDSIGHISFAMEE